MRLCKFVERVRELGARVDLCGGPDADVEVTSVVTDSRKVTRGAVFCALRGARADGAAFIEDAATRGAVAAITERAEFTPLAQLVVPDARAVMRLAAWSNNCGGAADSLVTWPMATRPPYLNFSVSSQT